MQAHKLGAIAFQTRLALAVAIQSVPAVDNPLLLVADNQSVLVAAYPLALAGDNQSVPEAVSPLAPEAGKPLTETDHEDWIRIPCDHIGSQR